MGGRIQANPDLSASLATTLAVRLLQSALEYSQQSNEVTRESLALLEIARQFASQPLASWVHVLGLPLSDGRGPIAAIQDGFNG